MKEIQTQIYNLVSIEYLKLTEEENKSLTDQHFAYLKCEFFAHAIFRLNQIKKLEFENYMSSVMTVIRDFDANFGTELYPQLKSFIPRRYMDYEQLDGDQKRFEYSAMLLRENFQSIPFGRLVEILRESVDGWIN